MTDWNLNWNKSSSNKWDIDWTKDKTLEQKVVEEKQQRISQELPVSVKKTQASPTLLGSIIRGAIKPVADVASNVLGGADLSNKYLGKVEGLGQVSGNLKENLKVLGKSIATGVELGSYATGGGAIVGTGKNVAKQGVKEFLKTSGKQLYKEGAITSGLGSIGYQGREGKINPLTVARDVGIGAVAAPLLGAGFNKLLGKTAPKVIDNVTTKVDEIADNSLSKSTVGIKNKTVDYLKKNPQEISNREVKLREVDGKVVIEDGRHTLQASKETGIQPKFVDVTSEYTGKPSTKIQSIISESQPVVAEASITKIEQPKTIQKVQPIKPEETVLNDIPEFKDLDPEVKKTTFQEIRTNYDNISKTNSVDDLIDISMGKKEVPQGLTKTSIYELTKNRKDLTLEQIKRLKNVAPESEAGLNLVTVKLRDGGLIDNPTDFIQATEKTMKEQVKKSGITNKTINRFLDGLECK